MTPKIRVSSKEIVIPSNYFISLSNTVNALIKMDSIDEPKDDSERQELMALTIRECTQHTGQLMPRYVVHPLLRRAIYHQLKESELSFEPSKNQLTVVVDTTLNLRGMKPEEREFFDHFDFHLEEKSGFWNAV